MLKKLLVALIFAACSTQAVDFIQTNEFIVIEGTSLNDETWVSSRTIHITGAVSNDLFASATEMQLHGALEGDVWGISDNIVASGVFFNSSRLAGQLIQIRGTHYGPVMALGTTVQIERTSVLYGDLIAVGENVLVEGMHSGDIVIVAQNATLGGNIDGDVEITASDIVILPGTLINGNLSYTSSSELVLPASVVVSGQMIRRFENPAPVRLIKENPIAHYMFALAAFLTGLVLTGLFPLYTGNAQHLLRKSMGLSALIGAVALFMIPLLAFMLLFTMVGSPLSILMFLFYLILLYLSKIVVALAIGSAILRRKHFNKKRTAGPLALGMLIIYTLTLFNAASMAVNVLVIILGLGALMTALFRKPVLVLQAKQSTTEV